MPSSTRLSPESCQRTVRTMHWRHNKAGRSQRQHSTAKLHRSGHADKLPSARSRAAASGLMPSNHQDHGRMHQEGARTAQRIETVSNRSVQTENPRTMTSRLTTDSAESISSIPKAFFRIVLCPRCSGESRIQSLARRNSRAAKSSVHVAMIIDALW